MAGRMNVSVTLRLIDRLTGPLKKSLGMLRQLQSMQSQFSRGSTKSPFGAMVRDLQKMKRELRTVHGLMNKTGAGAAGKGMFAGQMAGLKRLQAEQRKTADGYRRMNEAARAGGAQRAAPMAGPSYYRGGRPGFMGMDPRRFPGNLNRVVPRYAAYRTAYAGHRVARQGGLGILDASSERTAMEIGGLSENVKRIISRQSKIKGREYMGLSESSLMELGRTAIVNLEDPEDAGEVMEILARNAAALSNLYHSGKRGAEATRQFYRAADIAGFARDPKKLKLFMDELTARTQISGRDIRPLQTGNIFARMKGLKYGLTPEALGDVISMQDEVKGRARFMFPQFYTAFTRTNTSKKNMARLKQYGLRDEYGPTGPYKNLVGSDPFKYTLRAIKPLVEKLAGRSLTSFGTDDAAKSLAVTRALGKIGLLPSETELMQHYLMKEGEIWQQRAKAADARAKIQDAKFIKGLPWKDIGAGLNAVGEKFKDFADAFTRPIQGTVAAALGGIAKMLSVGSAGYGLASVYAGTIGAIGAGALWLGKKAVENPGAAAHVLAAAAHGRAAAALMRAAVMLGARGVLPVGGAGGKAGRAAGKVGMLGRGALAIGAGYAVAKGVLGKAWGWLSSPWTKRGAANAAARPGVGAAFKSGRWIAGTILAFGAVARGALALINPFSKLNMILLTIPAIIANWASISSLLAKVGGAIRDLLPTWLGGRGKSGDESKSWMNIKQSTDNARGRADSWLAGTKPGDKPSALTRLPSGAVPLATVSPEAYASRKAGAKMVPLPSMMPAGVTPLTAADGGAKTVNSHNTFNISVTATNEGVGGAIAASIKTKLDGGLGDGIGSMP